MKPFLLSLAVIGCCAAIYLVFSVPEGHQEERPGRETLETPTRVGNETLGQEIVRQDSSVEEPEPVTPVEPTASQYSDYVDFFANMRAGRLRLLMENGYQADKSAEHAVAIANARLEAETAMRAQDKYKEFSYPWIVWDSFANIEATRVSVFRNALVQEASLLRNSGPLWPYGSDERGVSLATDYLVTDDFFSWPPTMFASAPVFGDHSESDILAKANHLQQIRLEFMEQYFLKKQEFLLLEDVGRFKSDEPIPKELLPTVAWMRQSLSSELLRLREGYAFAVAEAIGAEVIPEIKPVPSQKP